MPRSRTARSFRSSLPIVVLAASGAVFGCATGASSGEENPGDLDTGAGFDVSGDGTGFDTGSGDSSVGDGTSDGRDASVKDTADAGPCDPSSDLTISCGVGECTKTQRACDEAGVPLTCKPGDPKAEVCDGKDNDCNGKIDEDLGDTTCGVGECKVTQKNCVDGAPKTCKPGPPSAEICNGKDDDCNGFVDDGFGSTTCGVGECKNTASSCESGAPKTCVPKTPSTPICNGKDNDCDGTIDTDFGTSTCGLGVCQKTVANCIGGVPQTCVPGTPGFEVCDGKDNDCNGTPDDGIPALTCGIGECKVTAPACVGGAAGTCTPGTPKAETCNGKDDDCNGVIDDGLPILTCGVGACVTTTPSCFGGKPQTCLPAGGSPELCNGKDDDCNGVTDDGPSATLCPPPAATTTTACSGGVCKTTVCNTGFVDVDGTFSNGCECVDSTTPHSCASASGSSSDVGTVGVGSSKVFTSNGPVVGRDDWIKVTFLNTKTDKLAHPKIQFTTNPGSVFQFEIIFGGCGGTTPVCGSGPDTATAKTTWEGSYLSSASGAPTDPGWAPILAGAYNPTSSNNATVYVRVFYKAGAVATCAPYVLNFQN
jgi:hypothetical protein